MSMGQWSKLPGELLDTIEENLVLYRDKVRVRAVCDSWNSHLHKVPNHRVRQLPWLLQALKNNKIASHALFNLREEKVYLLDLPEAQGKLFKGSSHGWVLTIQDLDPNNLAIDMHLINPLTRAVIQLPPRSAFPDVADYCADRSVGEEYALIYRTDSVEGINEVDFTSQDHLIDLTSKVILSSSPSYDDCVVVAIYGEKYKLAYCKCNDKQWTPLNVNFEGPHAIGVLDVIFHKHKLYALNSEGGVVSFDSISTNPQVTEIVAQGPPGATSDPTYLVECSDGGLLMVSRYVELYDGLRPNSIIRTYGFGVYELDLCKSSWIEVKDIGEDMLFLGCSSSISMSSRDFFPGYKGNCIYFTDSPFTSMDKKFKQEESDIRVFNLEDGSFEQLPGRDLRFLWPPPIWVKPPGPY